MEFYDNDLSVYIDPFKEMEDYRKKYQNLIERSGLKIPEKLIYQPIRSKKMQERLAEYRIKELPPLYSDTVLDLLEGDVLYCQGMIGASATVIYLEEIFSLGIKEIVFLGLAGSFYDYLDIGEYLLVTEAIRREGTSYHYFPADYKANCDENLLQEFDEFLKEKKIPPHKGKICTTDAPFRETYSLIEKLKQDQIKGIEMEISAVYTVAKYRNVKAVALTVISDILTETGWSGMDREKFGESLSTALDVTYEFLTA
ncbi:MAG: nucleoside phosphorylase [Candidatus Hodarchaeota archaeon]